MKDYTIIDETHYQKGFEAGILTRTQYPQFDTIAIRQRTRFIWGRYLQWVIQTGNSEHVEGDQWHGFSDGFVRTK